MPAKQKHPWAVIVPEYDRRDKAGKQALAKQYNMTIGMLRTGVYEWKKKHHDGAQPPATTKDAAAEPAPAEAGDGQDKPTNLLLQHWVRSSPHESTDAYEFHPLSALFPLIEGQPYEDLKTDIKTQGLREPGWLFEGKILEGRNRYRACRELGIPWQWRRYEGDDPLGFIVSLNLHRRHLTEGQRAMVGANLARLRQGQHINPEDTEISVTQDQAAKMVDVSPDSIQFARTVQEHGVPEVVNAVEQGELAVSSAAKLAKEAPEKQVEVIQQLKDGTVKSVAQALKGATDGTPKPLPGVERREVDEVSADAKKKRRPSRYDADTAAAHIREAFTELLRHCPDAETMSVPSKLLDALDELYNTQMDTLGNS